jgi:F-type H+-transporting ATPase subunit gamma
VAFQPQLVNIPQRGMATQQQLKGRMKAVGNIKKITKAMKMVSAAKLRAVQAQLDTVRSFQAGITNVWPQPKEQDLPATDGVKKCLVCITSDRGLCGAINSSISKQAKVTLKQAEASSTDVAVVALGDKGKSALERGFKSHFKLSIAENYRAKAMPFKQAAMVADLLLAQGFDRMEFLYNRFKNAVSFETTREVMYSLRLLSPLVNSQFSKYSIESGGYNMSVLRSLYEYRVAVRLYHMFQESATSEQSARMSAMDNSSKNATEMLGKLQLLYNRARQSKITTELCEIIGGAESLKAGQVKI